MSGRMLEVSMLGEGTVLRLEEDAWSMVQRLRQAKVEYAPLLAPRPPPLKIIMKPLTKGQGRGHESGEANEGQGNGGPHKRGRINSELFLQQKACADADPASPDPRSGYRLHTGWYREQRQR